MNNKVLASIEKNNSIYTNTRNWIIAWSLLLALWLQQAEARTAEEIICPIGMTSNVSASPILENVEQQTTPDYMSQVEAGLKKYYPQYYDFLRAETEMFGVLPMNIKNTINVTIKDVFEIFEDDITTEKDKITTILMFYEIYLGKIFFSNQSDVKVISKDMGYDIRYSAAKEISSDFRKATWNKYQEVMLINVDILNKKIDINKKWKQWNITPEIMQSDIEDLWDVWIKLFDKNLTRWSDISDIKPLMDEIEDYIKVCKISWKKPSAIGQRFIDEYNKIKK